jgi:dihydrofolate reductase
VEVEVPLIAIVAAVSQNGVIGSGGRLPWYCPMDLLHFKEVTMGSTVLFGRKTFESLHNPLMGRQIIVLTNNSNFMAKGCIIEVNYHNILDNYLNSRDILYISGGASIYKQFVPYANKMFITHISRIIDGDTFFPMDTLKDFTEISKEDLCENGLDFSFATYVRKG